MDAASAPIVALIPEHDDYLKARRGGGALRGAARLRRVDVQGGRPVGWSRRRRVLDEIVAAVNPSALPPTRWPPPTA